MATSLHLSDSSGDYVLLTGFSARSWAQGYPRHSMVPWAFARGIIARSLAGPGGRVLFNSLHQELLGGGLHSQHETHSRRVSGLMTELERFGTSVVLLQAPRRQASAPPKTPSTIADAPADVEPVRIVDSFTVELLTVEGYPVPQTEFEVTFATGEKWSGTLDEKGTATRLDPPKGPLQIRYSDTEDVLAKTLAVRVRRCLDARSYGPLFDLLARDPKTIRKAFDAYDAHFNDLGGSGLRQDLQDTFTDPAAYAVVASLLSRSGVSLASAPTYHDWQSQDSV